MLTQPQVRAALGNLKAVGAVLDAVTLKLFQNDILFTPNTVIGDLVEADFTGYADVDAVEWGDPYSVVGGGAELSACVEAFIATGSAVTNTIYGWYLVKTTGGALVYGRNLNTPVPITNTGDGVTITPVFRLPAQVGD